MDRDNETNNISRVVSLTIGGASLLTLLLSRKTREKVIGGVKQTAVKVNEASKFLAENREELIFQAKKTSNELSSFLKTANEDIQFIKERAGHLREAAESMKDTTKTTTAGIKELKDRTSLHDVSETTTYERNNDTSS
ncbi:hypothetical protein [Bacillus piscicola]|uniref:hypothetical protein n=1 Tax=Bacillus piscicola TaxID=1632684 RepID=UPI001F098E8C|nr:hypothetical protein [Bacillus piscicola]